eukprot:7225816-Prymnesium_polylepis.1
MWYERSPGAGCTTRDFSSMNVSIRADASRAAGLKCTSTHLPNRLELLLRLVLALPSTSSRRDAQRSCLCSDPVRSPHTSTRKLSVCFVASVLPAPDSPLMRMAWSF